MMAFEFPPDRLADCRRSYSAALEWYGTTQAVQDLERVRHAIGAERVNIFGASYGTRVGLTYMRMHPERVRSAVLAGVAPPGFNLGASFAADADSALAGLSLECAAQPDCAAIAPDLAAMARAIASRLERAPAPARWVRGGDTIIVEIDRALFVAGARFLLYAGSFTTNLPRVVRAAHDGDYAPFVSAIGTFAGLLNDQLAAGLFLSVVCAEDIDRIDSAHHARSTAPTLLRAVGVSGLMTACNGWPRVGTPPDFFMPIDAPVATLLFSGACTGTIFKMAWRSWSMVTASPLPNAARMDSAPSKHSTPLSTPPVTPFTAR
jgi:pimeloyl-ACP methyl ester carboxylesterase